MRATALVLLAGALASASASNYAHHFYSNKSGHIIPREELSNAATVYICHRIQDVELKAGEEALLESPGYPGKYPNGKKCGWNLKASDDSTIDISCPIFDLKKPSRAGVCKSDYLSMDGFKFCGKESVTATMTGGTTKLRFRSKKGRKYPGFQCRADALAKVTPPSVTVPPFSSCACGKVNRATRIVGGNKTEVNEYPWQVAMVSRRDTQVFCGATLINSRFVLTAAHCTHNLKAIHTQVLLGNHLQNKVDSNEKRVNVKRIIDHPQYNKKNMDKDLSLLELAEELDLADLAPEIAPACLPNPEKEYDDVVAIVSGWGALSTGGKQPNALQEVDVKTMTNDACNKKYGDGEIQKSMLCAENKKKDSCQGDSGGPLVTSENGTFSIIGVVSWGYDCASPKFPGVYARVTSELEWIKATSISGAMCSGN